MPQTKTTDTRRRDPEATRSAILDAAEALFVERGFAATSMSEIGRRAAVTKSLIHHHFGSKEELWEEVKRRCLAEYVSAQRKIMESPASDPQTFHDSLIRYFRFLQRNPNWVRLNEWMSLEDPGLAAPANPDLLRRGVERLARAQDLGTFRSDVHPWHILFLFFCLCNYWFQARPAHGHETFAARDPDVADEEYLEDMLKIFFEGILPREDES